MFLVPAAGLSIRDPETRAILPPGGADCPDNAFWCRRLRDGDVSEATPDEATSAPDPAPKLVPAAAATKAEPPDTAGPAAQERAK